ncbi:DUF2018 domain-containing protein [Helicobacter anseris]|uniref:DUF2018 domain-containing protein n=1 Tax=Helicobacter anseris TaxID=375926 RepID=A0A3D8J7Y6_9HELI|nr:DUF2018 family protein [Helicobacter anseris]RDU73295.1 DUF2018 domain-containing protein [Helicobacter anseris]
MEILEGDPIGRWEEIVFAANKGIVSRELQRLIEYIAICEILIEDERLEEKLQKVLKALQYDERIKELVRKNKNDIVIASMANILSQNE